MAKCTFGGRTITHRYPSSGVLAVQAMFDTLACTSVDLFGFDDPDGGSHPYHYWRDGSAHDGTSSKSFYRNKLRQGSSFHDFEAEHAFLFHVLGNGSWSLDASAYGRECVYPASAPACAKGSAKVLEQGFRDTPETVFP